MNEIMIGMWIGAKYVVVAFALLSAFVLLVGWIADKLGS